MDSDPSGTIADIEAEDIELGDAQAEDVAFDVDAGMEEDPEALDSEEEDALNEELGIDVDETESMFLIISLLMIFTDSDFCSPDACGSSILIAPKR